MERHTPHRTHLVYQPGPDPRLFLWGDDPLPHPAIEHLASLGRRASARIVTDRLTIERVRGTAIELLAGATALAALDAGNLERLPASVAAWSLAAKLGFDLVARERIVPLIQHSGTGMEARWGISLTLPEDAERFSHLARAFPPAAHAVPRDHERSGAAVRRRRSVHVWAPQALLIDFADALADMLVRRAAAAAHPGAEGEARERAGQGPW